MPKQRGRGGKRGRRGKKGMASKRELAFKEAGQEYAQVKKLLGNGSANVACFDGRDRLGVICGRMKNRVWIQVGDILLVSLREFEEGGKKCDIIYKYFSEEAKQLKALGELPDTTQIEERTKEEDDIQLVWEEGEQDQEDEEEDDDEDLPPSDSDDEYYNEDDEESEEEEVEKKPEEEVKPVPVQTGKKPIGNVKAPAKTEEKKVAPSKVDAKKAAQNRKKQQFKKETGGDSSSEDSKDALDDI